MQQQTQKKLNIAGLCLKLYLQTGGFSIWETTDIYSIHITIYKYIPQIRNTKFYTNTPYTH